MNKCQIGILISCILFSFSCEKEKIVEVYKTYQWNYHPAFQYENSILLNSVSVDNDLAVFSGTTYFNIVGGNTGDLYAEYDNIFKDNFTKRTHSAIQPINRKIPITAQITVAYEEAQPEFGKVNFISTSEYGSSNSYLTYLKMGEVDPEFTGFSFNRPAWNDCIAINGSGKVLIPYHVVSNGKYQLRLLFVDTRQTGSKVYPTEIRQTKIIKIEDAFETEIIFLQSQNDTFFVTTNSMTYLINADGNVTGKLNDYHLYSIIPRKDTLYAFGYDFKLKQNELTYSTNNGMLWNKVSTSKSDLAYLNFTLIQNKIVGYWRSQIWQIKLSSSGYSVVELNNDGLAGKIITSMVEHKDKVYVTTYSGLFYQDVKDLFKSK